MSDFQAAPTSKANPSIGDGYSPELMSQFSSYKEAPGATPVTEPTTSRQELPSAKGPRTPNFKRADFLRVEGPRGISARATVWLRHLGYFIAVILATSITQAALSHVANTASGGLWMLGALTVIYVTATIGTIYFPDARHELLEEARHYAFGIIMIPGVTLAILMWAASHFMSNSSTDVFAHTLGIALPIVYVATVLIPAVLFVRLVSGRRYFSMSRGDDEKAMRTYTRQGFLQQ